jgi:organic radical activating enzyme
MNYTVVIYLGSYCNEDCSYCDRGYITSIGNTRLDPKDIPLLVEQVETLVNDDRVPEGDPHVHFHGGEPFLFVDQMREIIDSLPDHYRYSILTNGTLIERNKKFLDSYGDRLNISISYDFTMMAENRGYHVDIDSVLKILTKAGCQITQLQWVIDMRDKNAFDIGVVASITDLYSSYNIGMLTLIPLRHVRGKQKFKSIIDEVDLQGFMRGFLQFIQLLYVLNIKISIDGTRHGITKSYFDNHKQVLLSPDGYIYSEFDFLDYKVGEARIGSWYGGLQLNRRNQKQEENLTLDSCKNCSQYNNCGIKYLYKLFKQIPSGKCEEFYRFQDAIVNHYNRLSKYQNLTQAVK